MKDEYEFILFERAKIDVKMLINQALRIVFLLSVIIPVFTVLIYGLVLFYYYRTNKIEHKENIKNYPDLTILIPTHNEEKIIDRRIKNLLETKYPQNKVKVIFIDDSTDETPNIIKKHIAANTNFKLIRFDQRMGYSPSILKGIRATDTAIVVLNEAGSFPRSDALLRQISRFDNPKIGAVTGKSQIINEREKVGGIESLYLKIVNFIRESESNMDSTFYIKGEATAYRKELVSDIKAVPQTGSIDTSMALLVRRKGYRSVFDPEVIFDEYAPLDDKGYIKQKTIRAANLMRNILIFKDMLFNSKYSKFGLLTLPFNFINLFITPILIVTALVSTIIGEIIDPGFFMPILFILAVGLLILFLVSKNFFFLIIELEISLLKALSQIFISKKGHDKIERVESTRRIT